MGTFIIAELGINHNGDIEIAKKMIFEAKRAGADAVKLQKRTIDTVYTQEALDNYRESPWGTTNRQQKEGLEFGQEEYDILNDYCMHLKMPWFASAWDVDSQEFLQQYDLPYNKVASAMLGHETYLSTVAEEGKPTFISTGMSKGEEVEHVVKVFQEANCPFELMHCVSTYPMEPQDANLPIMLQLKDQYNCKVGYSGHESGVIVSCAAVAMGATSLERHITLDRAMYGSDQAASLEIKGFQRLVEYVRVIEKAIAQRDQEILPDELTVRKKLRYYE
jgi:N-acetylneuraminate synthase